METELHNILNRQIKKYLTEDCKKHPQFNSFINAVNDSYKSFERDKELTDHAFRQSEKEYKELFNDLKKENELKQESISSLYESLSLLDSAFDTKKNKDLKELSLYLAEQLKERKRAQDNIKRQEEKYRNIIANMNLGLIEVDNDEIVRYANQSFCNVSGFELDEIIGKNPSQLFVQGEANQEFMQEQIELREKGISSVYQLPIKNKRGELRWWAISGAPNYDDHGNLLGSIGIHLDITDQKRLEEDLKQEKSKAIEASKAKEVFLANMSHEIRTPLNAIIGFLRELKRLDLTTTQNQFVENSFNAAQHLLSIINNILDISKIESGEMSLDNTVFSLKECISDIISILQPKARQKKILLKARFSDDLFSAFKADALKIKQILYNIIGNSLKFTNVGEICLECKVIKDFSNHQKLEICITDTGIGMSEEYVKHIFKKFNQEDSSISRKYGGTGLGMAITRELIHLMKGEIKIKSKKNVGTEISIFLDMNKSIEKSESKNIEVKEHISIEGTRVLLVEDNELNQLVAENSLTHFGCEVIKADNGKMAVEILSKQQFDIILMDIQMPELDGIEATKILRQEFRLGTPIIALTANAFKTEIDNCIAAGMNSYITKPFDEDELLKIIYKNIKMQSNLQINNSEEEKILYDLRNIQALSRGNDDFIQKMLSIFITQTQETIPMVEKAFEEKNYAEIARLIHRIKPSIEGVGIYSIKETVKDLEVKSKEQQADFPELYTMFLEVKETLFTAINQLEREIK
ncbi:PAS domain-containing hybrid sensor histidine kinase/response regulator [Chryseobacterium mucoviscidosis]|uniref:PAS domain-containing hybrid sensor histidine kinase/response regulator n=1 Tax=Chryseobacterium mucoviscidosis TaxID=1945581 RepID=UPI00301793A6